MNRAWPTPAVGDIIVDDDIDGTTLTVSETLLLTVVVHSSATLGQRELKRVDLIPTAMRGHWQVRRR